MHVGLVTRGLAFLLDASIINIGFLVLSGLVAFLATTLLGDGGGASPGVLRRWGRGLGRRRSSLPGVVLGARGPDAGDAILSEFGSSPAASVGSGSDVRSGG